MTFAEEKLVFVHVFLCDILASLLGILYIHSLYHLHHCMFTVDSWDKQNEEIADNDVECDDFVDVHSRIHWRCHDHVVEKHFCDHIIEGDFPEGFQKLRKPVQSKVLNQQLEERSKKSHKHGETNVTERYVYIAKWYTHYAVYLLKLLMMSTRSRYPPF